MKQIESLSQERMCDQVNRSLPLAQKLKLLLTESSNTINSMMRKLNQTSNVSASSQISTDVTINREPTFKCVMVQNDAKQIMIHLGLGVYMHVCLRGTYCL